MSKRKHLDRRTANPDFRARNNLPSPPIEEIQRRIGKSLTPKSFAAARLRMKELQLRERILTLPVMVCFVLSFVYRQLPSISELGRVLEREGLFDTEPLHVTKQALSKRLQKLPAELFVAVFNEAMQEMQKQEPPQVPVSQPLTQLREKFAAVYLADGSTLEALRQKLKDKTASAGTVLGGKMMCVISLDTRRVVRAWYTSEAAANDKSFCEQLVEFLPAGSMVVFDTGFFSFPFFDRVTQQAKFFVTRFREKTAYRVVWVLSEGPRYRDQIVEFGQYRSNPCHERVRLVEVLWGTVWYRYVTNVLDERRLSAREVCELYRRRWRIEEAFLVTKRLLGLSYLWSSSRNAVEIQVYATWLFYSVLTSVCAEVGEELNKSVERISVEMVFRSFYHFNRAIEMGEDPSLIPFLVTHAKLFGLVKAERKRDREKEKLNQLSWGSLS